MGGSCWHCTIWILYFDIKYGLYFLSDSRDLSRVILALAKTLYTDLNLTSPLPWRVISNYMKVWSDGFCSFDWAKEKKCLQVVFKLSSAAQVILQMLLKFIHLF